MTVKVDIVSEYKDKGAKAAEKSMARLQKSAKNLAVALGVGFSINKIVQFGKASVAEFEASELAAAKLQNTLKNTGQLVLVQINWHNWIVNWHRLNACI